MIFNILLFLIALGVLIFVHELGHFWAAKKLKVPVEEFAIGFPPRLFSKKVKETQYSLNLIFFGGYVKLKGENDLNDPQGFMNQPPLVKILVTIAGVFFNLVFAYLLFSFGYLIGLPEYSPHSQDIVIIRVLPNTVAEKAGIKMLDKLIYLKTENNKVIYFDDIKKVREILENYRGQEIILGLKRGSEIKEIKLIPERNENLSPLGVNLGNLGLVKHHFPYNFYFGWLKIKDSFINIFYGLQDFFVRIFKGQKEVLNEVVGPLGMFDIYNQFKVLGINYLFYFLAIVSLNLCIFNILPFPALDGGRFVFYLYELITKKRVSFYIENLVNTIGFIFLLILMVIITAKDIFVKLK
jgi:regulator of sigma E protease